SRCASPSPADERRDRSLDWTCREIVQANIGEVKNRIHLALVQTTALTLSTAATLAAVTRITTTLIADEASHIYYTALILEELSVSFGPSNLRDLYVTEFRNFNRAISATASQQVLG